jgi:hypothetical protein
MAAEKTDDKPTVYLLSETPDTLDKPVFDFSQVDYTEGRAIDAMQIRLQQKKNEIEVALSERFEDLVEQLEALTKEQKAYTADHGHASKILSIRITRLEHRLENWKDVDIDALQAQFDKMQDEQESNVLAGVTYVPQAWLTKGAPLASAIDWSDHSSLKYLRQDRFKTLILARSAARDDSPN